MNQSLRKFKPSFLPLRIEVIVTGNELLDGSIVDSNTQVFAQMLRRFGLQVEKTTFVRDDREAIAQALAESAIRADVVLVSGGLGPTSDDITLEVASASFCRPLRINSLAKKNVLSRMKFLKRKTLRDGHRKQFLVPKGARVLSNSEGTAPGIQLDFGDRTFFFLPGVPREYSHLLTKYVRPYFEKMKHDFGKFLFVHKVFGVPESELNEMVNALKMPKGVEVGFRTHLPENHVKFLVEAESESKAFSKLGPVLKALKARLGTRLFSDGQMSFEESIFHRLLKQKKCVAICESCTGGLASAMFTSVPGSSKVLDRSFIVYSYEAKQELLGVSAATLKKHGAVSKQTVIEMVKGALQRTKVDKAVAISGIAGPTGGLPNKPVGTIWLAAATREKVMTRRLQLPFDRHLNQRWSAYEALQMLADI